MVSTLVPFKRREHFRRSTTYTRQPTSSTATTTTLLAATLPRLAVITWPRHLTSTRPISNLLVAFAAALSSADGARRAAAPSPRNGPSASDQLARRPPSPRPAPASLPTITME